MSGIRAGRVAAMAAAIALLAACGPRTVATSSGADSPSAAVSVSASASASRGVTSSTDEGPPEALARGALEIARRAADDPGTDLSADAVATTRHRALAAADGGWVDLDGVVWAFVWSGHFHSTGPRPSGHAAPTGTQLLVLMDIASGRLTDLVISNVRPNIESLGTVMHVRLR